MNYLSLEDVSKSFDSRQLFEGVTFGIEQGQKVALVGVNGSGKSTLLRIIAGKESSDSGVVSFRKGLRLSILPQIPDFQEDDSVMEAVFAEDIAELNAIREYEKALHLTTINPSTAPDISLLIEKIDALNAWDYESQVKQILGQLGIHDFEQPVRNLSGGQRKRVALARALVVNPDFLILDEPTNHLDLGIIEWLENYLSASNLTLLMVTHDRYFLDRVCNYILELDNGRTYGYKGNYRYFLERKEEREQQERVTVGKAQNLMKKELEWMRRQPKARGTKARYRINAFDDLKEKASSGVRNRELEVNLSGDRQGKKILALEQVCKSYDGLTLIDHFNYTFKRKDRVGVVGRNGIGKSTLLRLVTGDLRPDTGKRDVGSTTKFGHYTQEEIKFNPNMRVLDAIQEIAEVIKLADGSVITASQLLNQFLFPPAMQRNLIEKLSGGEKRRLQLLRVLMGNPNFLILDEPTNDLDLMTLNVLEDYLETFDGCLMIVSHDRYFMDRLVDHLFVFDGEGVIRDFPGNYTDYREKYGLKGLVDKPEQKPEGIDKPKDTPAKTERKGLSFNEKREFEGLLKEIEMLEKKKEELIAGLNSESDYQKLTEWGQELEEVKKKIEEKEVRWLDLSERAG